MTQIPSVGDPVHYVSYGSPVQPDGTQKFTSKCRAATVTEVNDEEPLQVGLHVSNPTGLFFHPLSDGGCFQAEGTMRGGTWHWPETTATHPESPLDAREKELAARAARRAPSSVAIDDLARTLADHDEDWPTSEPGARHEAMAYTLLTDFTLTPREDADG